jgi:crotonobetainyl-CoA:carnitine CoA-transferase CaiB-like acyl-CoA transferase
MDGPLDGVRVVEVANWPAAPAGAALLADMGARPHGRPSWTRIARSTAKRSDDDSSPIAPLRNLAVDWGVEGCGRE